MKDDVKIPISFWIISGVGLLWNLVGLYSFYSDLTISAEALDALTDAQRQLYENVPTDRRRFEGSSVSYGPSPF